MNGYCLRNIGGHDVYIYEKTDSTNTRLKLMAEQNALHGSVVMAREQTHGRGRMNRLWLSRTGAGAWFSILTRPTSVLAENAHGIVFVSALALANALKDLTGANIQIKWPNDIVLNCKKLAGIMCEMRSDSDMTKWVVAGLGVNLTDDGFPDDLPNASSVERETGVVLNAETLLREFLCRFDVLYDDWLNNGLKLILDNIKALSATLNKKVRAVTASGEIEGDAVSFTESGGLVICAHGEYITLLEGDVSVRGISGYV